MESRKDSLRLEIRNVENNRIPRLSRQRLMGILKYVCKWEKQQRTNDKTELYILVATAIKFCGCRLVMKGNPTSKHITIRLFGNIF